MTIRKIAEPTPVGFNPRPCNHPTHGIPNMQVFGAGTYENTCDGCGHKTVFTIANPSFMVWHSILNPDIVTRPYDRYVDYTAVPHQCGCGRTGGCYSCTHH